MNYKIDDYDVTIKIEKKKIKNTYIRVKENNIIHVTTSYLVTNKQILKLIEKNKQYIIKCLKKLEEKEKKEKSFYLWGQPYEVTVIPTEQEVIISDTIITPSLIALEKWLKKEMEITFKKRLDYWYQQYQEEIPYPKLRIRKMKTRWGVCNRKNNTITLNSELIRYDKLCLDYVIVHELSHFVYFDHSKLFWNQVASYFPKYKEVRKELKN